MSALREATRTVPFSNGTEGMAWQAKWCDLCVHDHTMHLPDMTGPGCAIFGAAFLAGGRNEFDWPEAWLPEPDDGSYALPSRLVCLAFKPCTEGGCTGDPGADARAERIAEVSAYWKERR